MTKNNKPKTSWRAWTEVEGDVEMVYVSLDRRGSSIRLGQPLIGKLEDAVSEMIVHIRSQGIVQGWIDP